MAFDLGTAVGYLELDTTKFTKPLNEAQKDSVPLMIKPYQLRIG